MKIQIGTIVMNRTKKFLVPCLKDYGLEFELLISSVMKVGMGIGDMVLIKSNICYEKHIFILADIKQATGHFTKFIEWVRGADMYEDDYAYDNILDGRFHMIVIKLPESCYKAAELFKQSQFSKMYKQEEVEKYFDDHKIKGVLVKDHNYKIEYTAKINELFGSTVKPEELEGELEFPIRKEEETF